MECHEFYPEVNVWTPISRNHFPCARDLLMRFLGTEADSNFEQSARQNLSNAHLRSALNWKINLCTKLPLISNSLTITYVIENVNAIITFQMSTLYHTKLVKAQSTCVEYGTISLRATGWDVRNAHYQMPLVVHWNSYYPIIAGCMGINANIAINQMWTEPVIVWLIVAANEGKKKTLAL